MAEDFFPYIDLYVQYFTSGSESLPHKIYMSVQKGGSVEPLFPHPPD